MRRGLAAALFAVLAAPALAADEAAAKNLEGTYEVLSMTAGGKADPKAEKEKPTFVIKDGTITVKGATREETAKFSVDGSKKPAEIDIMPRSDEKVPGIYEAKDTPKGLELTIAFAKGKNGSTRPKDFKGEGEGAVVIKLLRKKEK
jgi:uncharacterized protein (TIGR03067 family)